MATVKLSKVCKKQSNQTILHEIDLVIEKGEFIVVVGPSGCGKSTLLRLIAGLDELSAGQILINDQCINTIPPAQRNMAMVFQNYALYPHMSVYDNMAYGLKMRKMKPALIKQKVTDVAKLLHLTDYLNRKPGELSGGQKQRVAMGRAIVRSPAVFLFDEPLSNLDAKLRMEMRHEIRKLHQQLNTTCLYVTHDQTEAMTMASRVVVLNQGKIEQLGTPQELYQSPASLFVAGFTGHYPNNFISGTVDLPHKKILTEMGLELPLPAIHSIIKDKDAVVITIRPEHLYFVPKSSSMSFNAKIILVDDMGSDQLFHTQTAAGKVFTVRTSAETPITEKYISLEFQLRHANLFDQQTGLRLGGWT